MKRIHHIAFLLLLLTISPLSAQESNQDNYPLGVFNFDFARLGVDEVSQINELESIGYNGMVLRVNTKKHLEELKRYQEAMSDKPFKVYAGFFTVFFNQDLTAQNTHLDKVIQSLRNSDAKLWIILRVEGGQKVQRKQIVDFLRSAAERAKTAGVELIIYPHWSGKNPLNVCLIESAEDAIPYLEEIQSENLFVSLHLCHEIKAGNGDRLNEVAAKIKPWLRLPSINGADIDAVNEAEGWKKGIQPLTMGDYDSSKLLKALKSIGYQGPVILHTWGLQKSAADHHQSSFKRFQEMKAALGSTSVKRKSSFNIAVPESERYLQTSRVSAEAWRALRQEIRSASIEEKVEYLLDRAEIEDIITTYAYSVDTREMSLHGELFKESFKQYDWVFQNQDRLKRVDKFLQRFTDTQHMGFPLVIQINGNTAYATASLNARHYDKTGNPMNNYLLYGQYELWLEKTSDGWKISKLNQVNRTQIHTSEAKFPEGN
jgi:sugar phosphate isomerase/epimerase